MTHKSGTIIIDRLVKKLVNLDDTLENADDEKVDKVIAMVEHFSDDLDQELGS